MSIQTLTAWQGLQRDYQALQIKNNDGTNATGIYTSGSVLSASVWEGQNQATIFAPTVAWYTKGATQTGYDQGQFSLSISGAQSLPLDPAGEYHVLVSQTTSAVVSPVWEGLLQIKATPGSTSPSPPDLITYDYCLSQLTGVALSDSQIDLIPWLVTAASQAWRLECNERYFDLRMLTEDLDVELDGYVRLSQTPIQIITRVQGVPNQALTISNSSAQTAQAYFSFTGYDGGYGANAKTATGITLAQATNGVAATPVTLLFGIYPTITLLANAINAVGVGWTASVTSSYGSWASTELAGGFVGQGCAVGAIPSPGAIFNVLTDLENAQLRPNSPMLWVGRQQGGNVLAQRWGPGGNEMFWGNGQTTQGTVRVTYQAGFSVIPAEVQYQVAQIVKWKLELGVQELLLKSEMAAEYKYDLADDMVHNLPRPVREAAGRWKQTFA